MKKLSIIIPVYYNEENLKDMYAGLKEKVLGVLPCEYEIIMVDDGSGDGSYGVMEELAAQDKQMCIRDRSQSMAEGYSIRII